MDIDTFAVLKQSKLLDPDVMALSINDLMLAQTASNFPDVIDSALIEDEMRSGLVGQNGYSLIAAEEINGMCLEMTRPLGLCHQLLPPGYLLCTTRVRRQITAADGSTTVVSKQGRFVTDSADIAAHYRERPAFIRGQRTLERLANQSQDDVRRLPALATHVNKLVLQLHSSFNAQLPLPGQTGNGGGQP
jgi:hypothetical protein